MHDNIYVEGLEEGQALADETWAQIEQEIALHSEEELKQGVIVRGFSNYLFLVIKKMNLEIDLIKLVPVFTAEDAEQKLADLNVLDIAPGGVSRVTGMRCPDKVWLINLDGLIKNPTTNHLCKFNKDKLGKVIVAHNGAFGPFYVGIPNSDVNGDGNFNCIGFLHIDDAIDFIENKKWLDGDYMQEPKPQKEE